MGRSCSPGPPRCSIRPISRRPTRTGACATRPASSPTCPGAPIRIIAERRPTISSPTRPSSASTIPRALFSRSPRAYRHLSNEDFVTPQSRSLVSARQLDRARILGAAMRVAYNISAAMPGVLPRAPMVCEKGQVVLTLPAELAPLSSERLQSRIRQFARLIGGDPEIRASMITNSQCIMAERRQKAFVRRSDGLICKRGRMRPYYLCPVPDAIRAGRLQDPPPAVLETAKARRSRLWRLSRRRSIAFARSTSTRTNTGSSARSNPTLPPKGLNEDIVRFISAKKEEPEWLLDVAARGLSPLADDGRAEMGARRLSADRLPGPPLFRGAEDRRGAEVARRGRSGAPARPTQSSAFRWSSRRFWPASRGRGSPSTPCSIRFRSPRPSRRSSRRPA